MKNDVADLDVMGEQNTPWKACLATPVYLACLPNSTTCTRHRALQSKPVAWWLTVHEANSCQLSEGGLVFVSHEDGEQLLTEIA